MLPILGSHKLEWLAYQTYYDEMIPITAFPMHQLSCYGISRRTKLPVGERIRPCDYQWVNGSPQFFFHNYLKTLVASGVGHISWRSLLKRRLDNHGSTST